MAARAFAEIVQQKRQAQQPEVGVALCEEGRETAGRAFLDGGEIFQ